MPQRRSTSTAPPARTVAASLQEYGRGVAGGLMFSLPLLYTMEMWWAGFSAHPWRLLIYIISTFILLLGYNRFAGLRHDASLTEVVIDSVEEMGLGIALATLVMFLLGRVTLGMSLNEAAGQIIVEAMTVAIGVSVGTAQLGGGSRADEGLGGDAPEPSPRGDASATRDAAKDAGARDDAPDAGTPGDGGQPAHLHHGGQLVLAFCGAMLFAANVAPTEEIVMIAVEISWLRLIGLASISLLIGALILFYSEFTGAERVTQTGGFVAALRGTVSSYAVALVAASLSLWFFGRFDGVGLYTALAQTVALGVAATLGASAGRLLLQ